jgi:transaldolase
MKLFIDSAKVEEIKQVAGLGLLDGVTTNPSLVKKAFDDLIAKGRKIEIEKYIESVLKVSGQSPVSLEVVGSNYDEMVKEGRLIKNKFGKNRNVYVKIPVNPCLDEVCNNGADGIKAIKELSNEGININCTLIFTPEQALLAAKAGAKIVSPFVGREDDYIREINRIKFEKEDYFPEHGAIKLGKIINDEGIVSGVDLIHKCRELFDAQNTKSEILAASIRNPRQFREVALAGAHIATLPFSVIQQLLVHKKTSEGMKKFTKDIVPEYARLLGRRK